MKKNKNKDYVPERARGYRLRVFLENNSAEHGIVRYTLDDIKNFLQKYIDGPAQIGWCLHDKDISVETGELVKPHVHIVMRYLNAGSHYEKKVLIKELPCVDVRKLGYKESAFAYLIHSNEDLDEKYDYGYDDVHLNFDLDTFKEYCVFSRAVKISKEERDAKANEINTALKNVDLQMKLDAFEKAEHKEELHDLYQETRAAILNGELKQRTYRNRLINEPDSLFAEMWDIYHAKLDKAFKERLEWMKEHCRNRKLTTIVIEGAGGDGKSNLAVQLCERNGYLYSVSGSKNDAMQDVLPDDDCYILNEARDDTLSFTDFLMLTEPFKSVSIKSRYANKMFFGSLLIITTPVPISTWYTGEKIKDVNYEGKNARIQFDRRINYVIKCSKDKYKVYSHNADGTDTHLYTVANPLLFKEEPKTSTLLDTPDFVLKGVSGVADTLGVADKYSACIDEFKEQQKRLELYADDDYLDKLIAELDTTDSEVNNDAG